MSPVSSHSSPPDAANEHCEMSPRSMEVGRDHLWRLAVRVVTTKVERGQELRDRAGLTLRLAPVDLLWAFAVVAACVGFHHAGIDGKTFALNEARIHARPDHCLEQLAQNIAVSEPA